MFSFGNFSDSSLPREFFYRFTKLLMFECDKVSFNLHIVQFYNNYYSHVLHATWGIVFPTNSKFRELPATYDCIFLDDTLLILKTVIRSQYVCEFTTVLYLIYTANKKSSLFCRSTRNMVDHVVFLAGLYLYWAIIHEKTSARCRCWPISPEVLNLWRTK